MSVLTQDEAVAARPGGLTYRPHIDGLRAVSVYLVVAFHSGLGLFDSGYLGVDVFFVLSGFLVTSILLRDLAGGGRVRWRHFYSRRVRRILPAALATLLITAIAYVLVASPSQALDALGGFRAACFYVANWYFIRQGSDYFAANVNTNPVLHFWSLAVEEQFYFVWPLLLGVLYAVSALAGRWRWWALRAVVAALALASAVAALHISGSDLSRAYYGTDTRAYELLAGALLALSPSLLRLGARGWKIPQWSATALLAGLIVLATSALGFSAITKGILATLVVSALIVAFENVRGGRAKALLSSDSFVYLGRISYGTYLWHWPVIVLIAVNHRVSPLPLFVIVVPVATLLSAASFRLLEMPIRRSAKLDRRRTAVIVIGFTSSILVGIFVMPALLAPGSRSSWEIARHDIPTIPDCFQQPVDRCTLVHGKRPNMVLIGDSHAGMLIPAFEGVARRNGLTFSVLALPHCPWPLGVLGGADPASLRACQRHQRDWYRRALPALEPDIVFLVHEAYDDPSAPRPVVLGNGLNGFTHNARIERAFLRRSRLRLQQLAARYPKVVVIEPIPVALHQPLDCLSAGKSSDQCSYVTSTAPTPEERSDRAQVEPGRIWSLNIDRLVCPRLPRCDAVVNGIIVKRELTHLTGSYSRYLAPALDALLHREGVLPPKP
jgi:peptidoglycan/LPS O-acetylase OafA/YrhL